MRKLLIALVVATLTATAGTVTASAGSAANSGNGKGPAVHSKGAPVHSKDKSESNPATNPATGGTTTPAGALDPKPSSANGAQKLTLLANPGGTCQTGATGGTTTGSFAVINFPSNGTVAAEVAIKDAPANASISVNLVQIPSGESCFGAEATITTDVEGHANVHLSEPLLAGTTGAFVQAFSASLTYNVDTMAATTH